MKVSSKNVNIFRLQDSILLGFGHLVGQESLRCHFTIWKSVIIDHDEHFIQSFDFLQTKQWTSSKIDQQIIY